MAAGELNLRKSDQAVSPWHPPTSGPVGDADRPFSSPDLEFLDEVIAAAELATGLRFSVYLGALGAEGADTRAVAEALLDGLGPESVSTVLLALSPEQRVVEIVTGADATRRLTDRGARLAVLNVVSRAAEGDLLGAVVNGVRTLADQAGILPERSTW